MFSPKQVGIVQQGLKNSVKNPFLPLDQAIDHAEKEERKWAKIAAGVRFMSGLDMDDWPMAKTSHQTFSHRNQVSWSSEDLQKVRQEFSDFEFILDCGAGAFGRVWLVKDISEQIVALKVIHRSDLAQKELKSLTLYRKYIKNFQYLIQIYHVGQTESFFFYTMEASYSADQEQYTPLTLDYLIANKQVDDSNIPKTLREILSGTARLHENQLAHYDIKPTNILVIDNVMKLGDIGLVSAFSDLFDGGTLPFIPPDLRRRKHNIVKDENRGIDCDLYAVGKILYLMLSGCILKSFPKVPLRKLESQQGQYLNRVLNKACANERQERYESTSDFLEDLDMEKNRFHMKGDKKGFWDTLRELTE